MSERRGDPPADVRTFLPRAGEPVEQYAERLRALHRDLTLVLEAVERGLAAAEEPADLGTPVPAADLGTPVPAADLGTLVPAGEPIEIVPAETEAAAAAPASAAVSHAAAARSRMPRVEVMPAPSGEQLRHDAEDDRRAVERPARRAEPQPERPALPHTPAVAEPAGFTAPLFPPTTATPQRISVSPRVAAAVVTAWLVVVALLVALLVS